MRFQYRGRNANKQRGAFAIEFALLSVFLGTLFLFTLDVVAKLSVRGKLDRLSFSIVNVVKERTQFYDEELNVTQLQAQQLYTIASGSMNRTMGNFDATKFGMVLEEAVDDGAGQQFNEFRFGDNACDPDETLQSIEQGTQQLSVVTTWNRVSPVYRVTLCYETDNLVAQVLDNGFTTMKSTSAFIGR